MARFRLRSTMRIGRNARTGRFTTVRVARKFFRTHIVQTIRKRK